MDSSYISGKRRNMEETSGFQNIYVRLFLMGTEVQTSARHVEAREGVLGKINILIKITTRGPKLLQR